MKNIIKKYWKIALVNILYFGIFSVIVFLKVFPSGDYFDLGEYLWLFSIPLYVILYGILVVKTTNKLLLPNIILFVLFVAMLIAHTCFYYDFSTTLLKHTFISNIYNDIILAIGFTIISIISSLVTRKIISKQER